MYAIDSTALTVGRGSDNDLPLDGDEFASAHHARFEPRRDGVYVEDIGSTNGTFVNGIRLDARPAARARRRRPDRRDRPEVRAVRISGSSSAESNVGRKRRHNEDNFVAAPPVFAVADGMGGAQAGEVASALAASTVTEANLDPSVAGRGARRRADQGREPARAPARRDRRGRLGDGHDDDGRDPAARRHGRDRPRRRLARLPAARRASSSS